MKEGEPNISYKETRTRALGYAEEFRNFLREHKDEHLLERFLKIVDYLEASGRSREEGGLMVTLMGERGAGNRRYYKVEYEDRVFFVKWWSRRELDFYDWHNLQSETCAAANAAKLLERIRGVGVIPFEFGGETRKGLYSVFGWKDGKLFTELMSGQRKVLQNRFDAAEKILVANGFKDVKYPYALYVEDEDMLYFFDLHQDKNGAESE